MKNFSIKEVSRKNLNDGKQVRAAEVSLDE